MKSVKVVVPGKVLISGEHAVVYGEPALVASVNKNMTVMVKWSDGFRLVSNRGDDLGLVKHALEKMGLDPETVKVTIKSDIPAGMGTSAALCAAVIKAASEYMGRELEVDEWFRLAWECEKKAHGNSSGVDPAAVIYGDLIWYIRDKERSHLKIPTQYNLVLVDTGKPRESTGEMVAAVAARKNEVLAEIGKVTMKIRKVMEKGGEIKELINTNGLLLEELGVVGEKAKGISKKLRERGYGVKITGAGGVKSGSGRLIVVGAELRTILSMGYEAFEVTIGGK